MKADWVKVTPSYGSGNATANVSSYNPHTGRKARTTTLTWKAANVNDVVRPVTQAGKAEYVDIDDAAASQSSGQEVTISGVSNSARLIFSLGNGELNLTLPSSYIANSITTSNGVAINGDPGASAEYGFSIKISVPANTGTTELSRQIIVTNEAGQTDVCTLTLAAGTPYITIAMSEIELDYLGTPVSVEVKSNTNWTIE